MFTTKHQLLSLATLWGAILLHLTLLGLIIVLFTRHRLVLECLEGFLIMSERWFWNDICSKGKSASGQWPMQPDLISVSVAVTNNNSLYFSLDTMLGNNRTTLSITWTRTYSYTWTERGTVTVHVKCGAQHKAIQDPNQGSNLNPSELKPGLFDSESSALTMN